MSQTGAHPAITADPIYLRPWVVVVAGLGLVVVGLALTSLDSREASICRAWLVVIGLLAAGAAISRRLQRAGWELEERLETAGMLAVGAFVALVAYLAVKNYDWTSAEFFLLGLIVIALGGAVLAALPSLPRKVLLSLLVVIHFGGIFVAGFNVPPGGFGQPPWLTDQLWTRVYRYYLGYIYMTNANHFYAPDPGPSTLAWFRIQYADDTYRWVQLPNKKDTLLPLNYTRSMVIADSTNLGGGRPPDSIFWRRVQERKNQGLYFTPDATKDDPHPKAVPIPISEYDLLYPGVNMPIPPEAYKEPDHYSRRLIASYVRYVAKNYPHDTDASISVKNVKVYRITHRLIRAFEMAQGYSPYDEALLYPYFMGKYDTKGELLVRQQEYDENGNPKLSPGEWDGFLYWVVPILRVPERPGGDFKVPYEAKDYKTYNYLLLHAGDIRSVEGNKDEPRKDEKKVEGR
jgi:hypothetical protein